MSNNLFWPVYKNLEHEFTQLMYSIHIDDKQLSVYSVKISDLILRAVSEIETISKELYHTNGGPIKGIIKFDEVALQYLDNIWKISEKAVLISSINCYLKNTIIFPFKQTELRTGKSYLTYTWNNAYQNLKHDRVNNFQFGSIKYLFDAMAALFILNIYFKDIVYNIGRHSNIEYFHTNQGSDIFSLKLYHNHGFKADRSYNIEGDYFECVYLLNPLEVTFKPFLKELEKLNLLRKEIVLNYIKDSFDNKMKEGVEMNIEGIKEYFKKLKDEIFTITINKAFESTDFLTFKTKSDQILYEVILNKNQF